MMLDMEILSSRVLLRSPDPRRAQRFYAEVLGLAVYREYGPSDAPGLVFFLGQGLLEVPGHPSSADHSAAAGARNAEGQTVLWLQVRDAAAEASRLRAAGADVAREPQLEPWGLVECWVNAPDDVQLVLVEVPQDHPLRRDTR